MTYLTLCLHDMPLSFDERGDWQRRVWAPMHRSLSRKRSSWVRRITLVDSTISSRPYHWCHHRVTGDGLWPMNEDYVLWMSRGITSVVICSSPNPSQPCRRCPLNPPHLVCSAVSVGHVLYCTRVSRARSVRFRPTGSIALWGGMCPLLRRTWVPPPGGVAMHCQFEEVLSHFHCRSEYSRQWACRHCKVSRNPQVVQCVWHVQLLTGDRVVYMTLSSCLQHPRCKCLRTNATFTLCTGHIAN